MFAFLCSFALAATNYGNPPVQWRGELEHTLRTSTQTPLVLELSHARSVYRLWRGSEQVDAGYFGFGLEKVFGNSPLALAEMRRFQIMRLGGVVLGGVATVLAVFWIISPYLISMGHRDSFAPFGEVLGVSYSFAGMAALAASVSAGMILIAPMFLSRAVAYNNESLVGLQLGSRF